MSTFDTGGPKYLAALRINTPKTCSSIGMKKKCRISKGNQNRCNTGFKGQHFRVPDLVFQNACLAIKSRNGMREDLNDHVLVHDGTAAAANGKCNVCLFGIVTTCRGLVCGFCQWFLPKDLSLKINRSQSVGLKHHKDPFTIAARGTSIVSNCDVSRLALCPFWQLSVIQQIAHLSDRHWSRRDGGFPQRFAIGQIETQQFVFLPSCP